MVTIISLAEVLNAIETDESEAVIALYLDAAEEDVRAYLSAKQLKQLPVIAWRGNRALILGMANQELELVCPINEFPVVRFEGKVTVSGEAVDYTADTEDLNDDGDTATLTPLTASGSISDGAYVVETDADGVDLTIDATSTTAAVTITRVLGLQNTLSASARYTAAILDLVKLSVLYSGLRTERVGQYSASRNDYQTERMNVLSRLVLAGGASLAR